jgi:uridine kinase
MKDGKLYGMDISPLVEKVTKLRQVKKRPIIFITGLSGSGKTTLAQEVTKAVSGVQVSFDWWLLQDSPARREKIMADYHATGLPPNPLEWFDWASFAKQLTVLQATGKLSLQNAWDQNSGEKKLRVALSIPEQCPIVVEGVYLFEPTVRHLADVTVLIESDINKSTLAALRRQAHRNPGEYLKVKELWYTQFDGPYFSTHRKDADIIFKGWAAQ